MYLFDAVIADGVYSIKLAVDKTGSRDVNKNRKVVKVRDTDVEQATESTKAYVKLGTLPQCSFRRIKALPPVAATKVFE